MRKFKLKIRQVFMGLVLTGFFLCVFSFVLEDSTGLEIISIAQTDNCFVALADHDSVCGNALAEHLNFWQSIFMALPQEKFLLGALGAVAIMSLTFIFQRRYFLLSESLTIHQGQYLKHHPSFLLFDFLRALFSQGILNPKAHI